MFNDNLKEWNRKPLLSRDWTTFRFHFAKAYREWKANLCLTAGQHFHQANAIDTSTTTTNHQADTINNLNNLSTATAADTSTVSTLTDTIAQNFVRTCIGPSKINLVPIEQPAPLENIFREKWDLEHFWGGVADGNKSGGGVARQWDSPSIQNCHTHGHKCPQSSFMFPDPATGHRENATKKDTRGGRDQDYKNN